MQVDDDYARKFMEGEGTALYFDKRLAPPAMRWLATGGIVVAAVAFGVSAIDDPSAWWGLGLVGIAGLATVTFWSLRTVVTQKFIHIQHGVGGRKISVADVVSVDAVDYDWVRFGGWGVRRDLTNSEVAYNMMGDQGRAVKIVYRDGKKTRTVLVSAEHPERLRDAIRSATAGAIAAGHDALAAARASLGVAGAQPLGFDTDASVATNVAVETVQRR